MRSLSDIVSKSRTDKRRKRLILISLCAFVIICSGVLVLYGLRSKITYFRTPADLLNTPPGANELFRLGGLVKAGSILKSDEAQVRFVVSDAVHEVVVNYRGLLPDLFREGQGVIVDGAWQDNGTFQAHLVLAKHDETYMPPQVVEALKRQKMWATIPKGTDGDRHSK